MKILLRNIGAHQATMLTVPTIASIHGPSTAGKSTIADGLCLALTGKDASGRAWVADRLRDPERPARVSFTFDDGRRILRTFAKRPGALDIDGTKMAAQTVIDEHLQTTDRRELVRCILAPLHWRTLLGTPKARAMRDALLQALPPVDVRPIVADAMADAGGLQDSDPMVLGKSSQPDTAMHRQAVVNRETDRAFGAHRAAVQRLESIDARRPATVDAGCVERARAVLVQEKGYRRWQAHALAVATNDTRRSDHKLHVEAWEQRQALHDEREQARVADWQTRRQYIGDEPAGPTGDAPDLAPFVDGIDAASAAVRRHDAEIVRHKQAIHQHRQKLDHRVQSAGVEHRQACVELRQMQDTETCPTCGRGADEQAIARLQAQVDGMRSKYDTDRERIEAEFIEESKRLDGLLNEANQRLVKALEHEAQCHHAHAMAKQAHDEHARQARAVEMHRRRLQALGGLPAPVAFSEPAPVLQLVDVPPEVDRPDVDPAAFERARQTVHRADRAADQMQRWTADREEAAAAVERMAAASRAAEAEADRVGALVRALREAPTTAAAQQVQVLHDAMHAGEMVRVRFAAPHEAGDVVSVSIEGRPWFLASDGMQVVADLALRDALRRLACELDGLEWLRSVPVIVDRAQDWSGDMCDPGVLSGPTIYLYTDDSTPQNGPAGLTVFDERAE